MQREGLPLAETHWVDSVFRFVRSVATLELAVVAMLTAEIIAVPYYKSLHDATTSPLLQQICQQLLRDEMQHLRFQVDTLSKLRRQRSVLGLALTDVLQQVLFGVTLLVVWQQHRGVFQTGGFSLKKYWTVNWQRFQRLMNRTPVQE